MKLLIRIFTLLWLLIPLSCVREQLVMPDEDRCLPEGTPVVMNIRFGVPNPVEVNVATRAEATRADESRVHDLYVMIFDSEGENFYSRFFTYEHLNQSLSNLDANSNEGWYVENSDNSFGVVKIATEAKSDCKMVLLANVDNTITSLNHRDPIDVLSRITTYDDLCDVRVTLEQEIVNRADLFMMIADTVGVNTGSLSWGSFVDDDDNPGTPDVASYSRPNGHYQLRLRSLDAKVKFWIKYNEENIDPDKCDARKWQVFNVPSECYLIANNERLSDISYFDSQRTFFEGVDTLDNQAYQVFSFYMLENLQDPLQTIPSGGSNYYLREKESDASSADPTFTYAPANGTYVKFDLLLGLKALGVQRILGDMSEAHALTTEAMYTVHLGQFKNSNPSAEGGYDWNNYTVERSTFYNYFITINNSKSIYAEVLDWKDDLGASHAPTELQPGQEGSLLLSTNDIVNCDAHYGYHCLTFNYTPGLQGKKVSWYIKTPFDEGGAKWIPDESTPDPNDGEWEFNCKDYLWVQFGINAKTGTPLTYSDRRVPYPGDTHNANWNPKSQALADGQLMDIHQLYDFILEQTRIRNEWLAAKAAYAASEGDDPGDYTGAFLIDPDSDTGVSDNGSTSYVDESKNYVIRVTAFIDEYYYEKDPRLDPATATADPDLWREFVNKDPRELHILSEAHYSADGQSDVITSSHSIVQQSIQTFYNTYSPDLRTLWGTEHTDEMEYRIRKEKDPSQTIWPWWPDGRALPLGDKGKPKDEDNGRFNTARIWGVSDTTSVYWEDIDEDHDGIAEHTGLLDYSVDNNHPELKDDYHYLAYSCLTRNRDNNGNGIIDPDEIRWYTAAYNQLVGMWVGNESLSPSARLYQPENKNSISTDSKEWRAWVVSSTIPSDIADPRIVRAEEGCSKSAYSYISWITSPQNTFSLEDRHHVSSVRCVRNIGTYNSGGETVDFSYADLNETPQQYYEAAAGVDGSGKLNPNNDGTYTLRFSRLDPRSIREYTSEDLPYHEEYSMHNRVYLELNMQSLSTLVYSDKSLPSSNSQEEINDAITSSGHNSYCPAGYRFPNMTELLLMSAMQPSGYWNSGTKYPCRTFSSRGVRGSKPTPGESQKIGWGFDAPSSFHMHNARVAGTSPSIINGVRCVRDNNCTGEITGSISVPGGDKLHMGDSCTIKLNITSMGSAIKSLNLYLVYVNASGAEDTRRISIGDLKLSGVAIQDAKIGWKIPSDLTLLGDMSIRAVVVNNADTRKILEAPIRVISPVYASVRLLPCVYYNDTLSNPTFPVLLTVDSPSSITSWRLSIKDPDKETINVTPAVDHRETYHWNSTWQFAYTMKTLIQGTYSFQLEVITSDGYRTRSNIASMDILHVDYRPNPRTDYAEADSIKVKWEPDVVEGMNLTAGDFIEANMDISHCTYVPVMQAADPTKVDGNRTNRLDNLISIGITDSDHATGDNFSVPYVYHVLYPTHSGGVSSGQDWLNPVLSGSSHEKNGTNYRLFNGGDGTGFVLQSGNYYKPDLTKKQIFRLDREGAFWNGQWINPANWNEGGQSGNPSTAASTVEQIISSETFYIGSTWGRHRSRARYCFVRAVHNSTASNAVGGSTGFNSDPVNGGNL